MSTDFSKTTLFGSTEPLLTCKEAGQLFSVSHYTIRSWITAGELRSVKVGGSIRLRMEDLRDFVKQNEQKRGITA